MQPRLAPLVAQVDTSQEAFAEGSLPALVHLEKALKKIDELKVSAVNGQSPSEYRAEHVERARVVLVARLDTLTDDFAASDSSTYNKMGDALRTFLPAEQQSKVDGMLKTAKAKRRQAELQAEADRLEPFAGRPDAPRPPTDDLSRCIVVIIRRDDAAFSDGEFADAVTKLEERLFNMVKTRYAPKPVYAIQSTEIGTSKPIGRVTIWLTTDFTTDGGNGPKNTWGDHAYTTKLTAELSSSGYEMMQINNGNRIKLSVETPAPPAAEFAAAHANREQTFARMCDELATKLEALK